MIDCSRVKLSVVVPVYNIVSYMDRCVESIVSQTYRNLEVILVDDGSSDGSGEKCDLWAQRDPRICVIHKSNGGLVSARQSGVKVATGDYLAYVDGDDWIEEVYAEMLELAITCDADIVTMGLVRDYVGHSVINSEAFEAGIYKGERLKEEFLSQLIDREHFFRSRINGHITTKVFKTELVKRFQMSLSTNAAIGEDAAVVYPCFWAADCIVVLGRNAYHYVMRPGSVMDTRRNDEDSLKAVEESLNAATDRYADKVPGIRGQAGEILLYISLLSAPHKVLRYQENEIYPFKGLMRGDKVLLYGAGRFGTNIYRYLEENQACEIVGWTDKAKVEGILSIEDALKRQYDKIVIAILLADVSETVVSELVGRGITVSKIVRIMSDIGLEV